MVMPVQSEVHRVQSQFDRDHDGYWDSVWSSHCKMAELF